MLYDLLRVMILEVPILGTFWHILGAGSDWHDLTPLPMGPYPVLVLTPVLQYKHH